MPKKPLRDLSGIQPGDEVIIEANEGELIIKKIYSIDELLSMSKISTGTPESIEADIEKEREIQERLTNEEHFTPYNRYHLYTSSIRNSDPNFQ